MEKPMELIINGEHCLVAEPGSLTLAQYLRENRALRGAKIACDEAACGACTVLAGGLAIFSCHTLLAQVDGESITTIEGISRPGQFDCSLQAAFVEMDAVQCGFCTPGMILAIKAALAQGIREREELAWAISGNVCRCGAYARILDAAEHCAK
jgi:aerobic-type carbon monoxide dehydrogenase small subunit (CoxS/CutS family)